MGNWSRQKLTINKTKSLLSWSLHLVGGGKINSFLGGDISMQKNETA